MATPSIRLTDVIDGVISDIKNDVNNPNRKYTPKETKRLLDSIQSRYSELSQYLAVRVPQDILNEYDVGMTEAGTLIKGQGIGTVTGSLKGKVHLEAVSNLATESVADLQSAIRTASRNGIVNIQGSLRETQDLMAKGILAGNTRKQTQKRVASSFEESGLTSFITTDNRKLPLDFYSQTVVRTKTKMANVQGAVNRYIENGIEFVQVSKHGATCIECARREGLILSLTGETAGVPTVAEVGLPPYHPNCRHSVKPIVSLDGRAIKPFMPNSDPRSQQQRSNYSTEQKIRRRANVEKKDYMRMVAELGDEAPKTIGAYRRMKRKDDDVWKGLQAKYKESTNLLRATESINPDNQFKYISKEGDKSKAVELDPEMVKFALKSSDGMDMWGYFDEPMIKKAKVMMKDYEGNTVAKLDQLHKTLTKGKVIDVGNSVSVKALDDFKKGKPSFKPSVVNVSERTDGRGALASAPSGSEIQVHKDFWKMDNDTQKYTIAHEVGHIVSNAYPELAKHILDNPKGALGKVDSKAQRFKGVNGTLSPEESWADSFSTYFTDTKWLKDKHPDAYDFVKVVLGKIPEAEEYLKVAMTQMEKAKPVTNKTLKVKNDISLKNAIARWRLGQGKKEKFEPNKTKMAEQFKEELYEGHKLSDLVGMKWDNPLYDKFSNADFRLIEPDIFNYWDKVGVKTLFGSGKMTLEGIANAFNPDPKRFRVRYTQFDIYSENAQISLEIQDLKGYKVGTVSRELLLRTDSKGVNKLYVDNSFLELEREWQGQNIATQMYFQMEQLYQLMANGKPVQLGTLANLDVGGYAWTRHGFDFMKQKDRDRAQLLLREVIDESTLAQVQAGIHGDDYSYEYWSANKERLREEHVNGLGYDKIEDIKHTWQYASLDDGMDYSLDKLGYSLEGDGHFGKWFMLGKVKSWHGKKVLGEGNVTEEISNLYYEKKGIK